MNSTLEKLIPLIRTVAPTIATALGGPLAGTAVALLSNTLTGSPTTKLDELSGIITSGDTDVLVKLKKVEADFKVRMKELGVDVEKVHAQDRDSARNREIQLKDKAPAVIAVVSFVGFFGILLALMFVDIPPTGEKPLLIMLGVLGGIVTSIAQYYYGSSKGSKEKTAQIDRLIK